MTNVQFTSVTTDDGAQFLTVFAEGKLLPPVDSTHPNFETIKALCLDALAGETVDVDHLVSLFDVAETVRVKFERLSDRIAVKGGTVTVDGDPIHGTLQEQILQFLDAGEDFAPLVEFYEKLLTNPLGDVREGLYDWINGQRAEGNFTITPEGDILGYKSVKRQTPEWRTEVDEVFVPSRRGEGIVNGTDVSPSQFIEQVPGDVVEMPRSRVLHAPSQACGDGLHIGTFSYAKDFYGGDTVMLVKFSPRDIVSKPDSNAVWKLRVCRYEVVGEVSEPLDVPVYSPQGQDAPEDAWSSGDEVEPNETPDMDLSIRRIDRDAARAEGKVLDKNGDEINDGDTVRDEDGNQGTVDSLDPEDTGLDVEVCWDGGGKGYDWMDSRVLTVVG